MITPIIAAATPAQAQPVTTAPMTAQDLISLPRAGAPIVSPDGQRVLYTTRTVDPESFETTTSLWLLPVNSGRAKPVTVTGLEKASSFAFGPDGDLYYLAPKAEDEPPQLWKAPLSASGLVGKARQLSTFTRDIGGFKLSPDGKKVAVWAEVARDCDDVNCTADDSATDDKIGSGRLYDASEGFVRHWDRWKKPGIFSRVFTYDVSDSGLSDPQAADGPADAEALIGDTPIQPFGGAEDIAWAQDSQSLFFTARQSDRMEPRSTNLDIYRASLNGTAPTNITADNAATDTLPTPSPDGKWLAYAAMERPNYEADRLGLRLYDMASGEIFSLAQDWDRSVGSITWSSDAKSLIVTAVDELDQPAFRVEIATGKVEQLDLIDGDEAHISNITSLPDGDLLFTQDSMQHSAEIYLSHDDGIGKRLTDIAYSQIEDFAPITTERFTFAGAGGDTVSGWITKLADSDAKMPAILYVHGGPQGSFYDSWSTRWNARTVASQGYAVVAIDFHGSTGYGQDFTDSINRDWGGKPLEDLQKGLATALKRDPQIDGSRACAMGASYGGFMMNWIEGQWPDRFNCLVQHDGLFDMRSFYYTTEESWFPRWDFGGSYEDAKVTYERWNPVNHVDKWKTPMLVITGEKDFRVPYSQALGAFTALQERDIPAKLLVFPDENHWVLNPENSLQWHETVFDWLDQWLKP
ncbi:alpha/beta hydrolase family protein [Altericroceibacterium endophyticum]|nr:S9 family peptidase [Altericroceibacterium endophyticum]